MRISQWTTASAPSHVVGMPGYWYLVGAGSRVGSVVRTGTSATATLMVYLELRKKTPMWPAHSACRRLPARGARRLRAPRDAAEHQAQVLVVVHAREGGQPAARPDPPGAPLQAVALDVVQARGHLPAVVLRPLLDAHVHLAAGGQVEGADVHLPADELEGVPVAGDQEARLPRAGDGGPGPLEEVEVLADGGGRGRGRRDGGHGQGSCHEHGRGPPPGVGCGGYP